MRVIAGSLRHRKIEYTNLETTRETQDRVREAVFNMIGPYFSKGVCLDLFCGSGSMAIEAYSRGMSELYLNDLNKQALKVAKSNLDSLDIKNYHLSNMDYIDFINNTNIKFDYIFLDPPYKMVDISKMLTKLLSLVKVGTVVVFEMDSNTLSVDVKGYNFIKERKYGKKKILIYEAL